MWETIKHVNRLTENQERQEREKGVGKIYEEVMAQISPDLMKNIVHIQKKKKKNQQIPSRINPKKYS